MNHRIKQLALEAFQPINDIASEGIADRHTFDQAWFQSYNQKFAELLIRECMHLCVLEQADPRDTVEMGCALRIKKHFEVDHD